MSIRFQGRLGNTSGPSQARARAVFPAEAEDGLRRPSASEHVEELDERPLALAAHEEIHEGRAENGVRIEAREVAAPDDGDVRKAFLQAAGERHRRHELRAWHYRHGDE